MKESEVHIAKGMSNKELIAAIDMIIEAQDKGFSLLVTNDDETKGTLYKNAWDCKVTVDALGMKVDVVALRREALKHALPRIIQQRGSFTDLVFSKLTKKQAEALVFECEDAFFNEEHWKQEIVKGGLSYKELREMADYLERTYNDATAYAIANTIRTRVRCAEELEKQSEK